MNRRISRPLGGGSLDIDEIRLIAICASCTPKWMNCTISSPTLTKSRHNAVSIHEYADQPVLAEDIARVDEIYLWFLRLKERANGGSLRVG